MNDSSRAARERAAACAAHSPSLQTDWAHHVTMRLAQDRAHWDTSQALRHAARVLLRHGASRGLLAFRVVDTHVHALLLGSRAAAGQFAQAVGSALTQTMRAGTSFEPCRVRPVRDAFHLRNAARYVARQEEHHGLLRDALHEGSSVPDALGLRVVDPSFAARARRALPRVSRAEWAEWIGWDGIDAAAPLLLALPDAAAAAVARPDLAGRHEDVVQARHAAVHVASRAGLRPQHVGNLLRIARRTVFDALARPPTPELVYAVGGQLRLRGLLGARAAGTRG